MDVESDTEDFSKPFTVTTFLSALLVLANHISDMWAFAQPLDDQSLPAPRYACMMTPAEQWYASRINHAVFRERKILKTGKT